MFDWSTALAALLTPMILSFVLGGLAGAARADLHFPDGLAKGLAVYLMFAIGFKGGVAMNGGAGPQAFAALGAGIALGFVLPFIAFPLLRLARAGRADAAAISAHYGSISIVTFVTAASFLQARGIGYEGYLIAVMAAMETPAILSGLWLARERKAGTKTRLNPRLLREVLLNGSVVLLLGGFAIGWATGADGMAKLDPFVNGLFNGALCLFLLDMGMVAARILRAGERPPVGLAVFAFGMPLVGAGLGLAIGWGLGLSVGGIFLFGVLGASASYIAVPAAMRLAIPSANAGLSIALSLGLTFPFNLIVGLPLYFLAASSF